MPCTYTKLSASARQLPASSFLPPITMAESNGNIGSTQGVKANPIPNTKNHPQIIGQQVPETYNTIRYTQEGATSRSIIENELKGDISNFTNEEIDAAIASYNAKNQG